MSTVKSSAKKRVSESETSRPEKLKRGVVDDDFDAALSIDIKGIVSALQQIRESASQKKNEQTSEETKCKLDELKKKCEKERQSLAKALSNSSKECENLLKNETAKFQAVYAKFCKEKKQHICRP